MKRFTRFLTRSPDLASPEELRTFQMHLVDEWLSTGSDSDPTHWSQVFLPLEKPILVKAGEKLHFALKRPEFGEWTWTSQYGDQRQRQSTFLSQPLSPERMLKASDSYQPILSKRGEAAQWLLSQLTGESPVGELAIQLQARYPLLFVGETQAVKFVKDLVERIN